MDVQEIVTGVLLLGLLLGAVLAAPLSLFLLWLYRRAVLKGMSVAAGVDGTPQPPQANKPSSHALRLTAVSRPSPPGAAVDMGWLDRAAAQSLRRAALTYTMAGLAFAAVLSGALQLQSGTGILPLRSLFLTTIVAWPIVLTLGQLVALGWKDWLGIGAVYLAITAILALLGLATSPELNLLELIHLWLISNGLATLLLTAFLTRRVRAVGPLVFVFMVAGLAGAQLLLLAVGSSDAAVGALVQVFGTLGLDGRGVFLLVGLWDFLLLGLVGWALLRLIGRRYRQKRMSDQSLTLDAMWLLFAVVNSITSAQGGLVWLLTGPIAFVLYKLVLWIGFARFVRPAAAVTHAPTLLLLRVFSLGPRSLHLFDALAKRWLRAGPISLIAGPDLVTGTVEPHEFLDFLGGQLSRQFVQDKEDLARRLSDLDTAPDPDGRYRVNEFFCRADTWQMTMQQLSARSDAVLMDLRSFSPSNQGCVFELEQLLDIVPLPQVLLIVDRSTDREFLADTLQRLWLTMPPDSPNRDLQDPEIRLFEASDGGSGAETRTLLGLLFAQLGVLAAFEPVS